MESFVGRKTGLSCALALALLSLAHTQLRAEPRVPADEVIRKAVARAQQAEAATNKPAYTYTKVSVTEELDSTGKVKEHKEKVYQVYFNAGQTHVKLLEVNGRPAAEADLRKQNDNELMVRQLLGTSKASGGNRENFLTPDLVARFDFKLLGQKTIDSRPAYQIAFQPKHPEPPIHRAIDKLLNRISGTLWIDADEFEMARAEIQLRSEVDLLGGMIGCLKHLAFTMTRTRTAEGVWLNSGSSGDFEGRKLLDSLRIKTKTQSSNFKPVAMNS